jgi:predicted enzyme related to lactoylglutathione lyase
VVGGWRRLVAGAERRADLFGWEIDASNPVNYDGHVTFYVEVHDVEVALAKAESLGGSRVMGPAKGES